jgi:hypothetical protein
MSYYLRLGSNGGYFEPWKIGPDIAVRLAISNPERGAGTYFEAAPGETIWNTIRRLTPWFEPDGQNPFHEAGLRPGEYYPRMARPINFRPSSVPGVSPGAQQEVDVIATARSQLTVLTRQLDRICQTVHPAVQTFETFGHDIRNLLILASTEVEAHWCGVLSANGVKKDRYSTNDYVHLLRAMKLDEYAVTFPSYPWLDAIEPYKGWGSTGKPTQDLRWYDSYNAVKHNREANFARATLRHVFEAISASVIMMAAQFGEDGIGVRSEVQSFFKFSAFPYWSPSDLYIESCEETGVDWSPVAFNLGIKGA